MRYNIELLKADIADEFEKLSRLEVEFNRNNDILAKPDMEVPNYDRGAIGYILHNFYNGCENIFANIARFFENEIGPSSWHKDLLKRMTLEIPGFRPKVIDRDLYLLLDDLRAFRHKFRHLYSFELDWEKEKLVAGNLKKTLKMLKEQITKFIDSLDELTK